MSLKKTKPKSKTLLSRLGGGPLAEMIIRLASQMQ
jgi:hypothetical protein